MYATYFVGPGIAAMSLDSWRMAAVLSCTGVSALSHESAAERHRVWSRGGRSIHVSSHAGRSDRVEPDIRFHRSLNLRPTDVERIDLVTTTTIDRTIVDLGSTLTKFQLAHVIHEASFRGTFDETAVRARLAGQFGDPWTAVVRSAIELHTSGSAGTRSATEDRFLAGWIGLGLPEPLVNDPGAVGQLGIEPDFVWPERRLVLEIDGDRGHARPGVQSMDRGRDGVLAQHEWRVIRIHASSVWSDLPACIARVRNAW
jgi:hypothetical protein